MTRRDLRELALIRLKEAGVLLRNGKYDGAYYLSGYIIECALKACIAKQTQRYEFPDKTIADASHTHKLKELLKGCPIGGCIWRDDPSECDSRNQLERRQRGSQESILAIVFSVALFRPDLASALTITLMSMKDPLIRALRKAFGMTSSIYGMRLGGNVINGIFVEQAYIEPSSAP